MHPAYICRKFSGFVTTHASDATAERCITCRLIAYRQNNELIWLRGKIIRNYNIHPERYFKLDHIGTGVAWKKKEYRKHWILVNSRTRPFAIKEVELATQGLNISQVRVHVNKALTLHNGQISRTWQRSVCSKFCECQ